jgi:hypothetical protein
MKQNKKIRDLRSLDNEIHRLRVEAKNTEKRLEDNLDYLREHGGSFFVNSFFCRKKEEEKNNRHSFFRSEKLERVFEKMADRVADRAADGVDSLLNRFFSRKEE